MTDIADLRAKTESQLIEDVQSLRKEAFNLRFQRANGQLENTARVRIVRRDIARIMLLLEKSPAKRDNDRKRLRRQVRRRRVNKQRKAS